MQLAERFKDSDQPYFKDTYGWALIKQGNIIEGLNILNQVIIAAPDVPVFRYHLGVALYKNGDSGSAISELKQALEFQKKSGSFSEKKEAETLLEDLLTKTKTH